MVDRGRDGGFQEAAATERGWRGEGMLMVLMPHIVQRLHPVIHAKREGKEQYMFEPDKTYTFVVTDEHLARQ